MMNAKRHELREAERSLRGDLADVQELVLDLNDREATLLGRRSRVEGLQKQAAIDRQKVVVALRKRRPRVLNGKEDLGAEALDRRLKKLDHTRARLKASGRRIDDAVARLDAQRRPFVEAQSRLLGQIEQTVDAQHDLHFQPHVQQKEPDTMKPIGPDAFRRATAGKKPVKASSQKPPLASAQRLEELQKRLEKHKPAPQLNPPGMTPNVAQRVKANKAVGDEIVRIQKAIADRRGQAQGGFKRSAGG